MGETVIDAALRIGDEKRHTQTAQRDICILRALMRVSMPGELRQELMDQLRKEGALS
jgi:hypothetical protein